MNWKYLFAHRILDRGYEYYMLEDVYNLSFDGTVLSSIVRGREEYDVEIVLNQNKKIEGMYCSCPHAQDGNNCKHMVATLLEAKDQFPLFSDEAAETYFEEDEYDEFDEYDAYGNQEYYEDEYDDYKKELVYSPQRNIENLVSIASIEEKDLFIKKILYSYSEHLEDFIHSIQSNDKNLFVEVYSSKMNELHKIDDKLLCDYILFLINRMTEMEWYEDLIMLIQYVFERKWRFISIDIEKLMLDTINKNNSKLDDKQMESLFNMIIKLSEKGINQTLLDELFNCVVKICKNNDKNKTMLRQTISKYFNINQYGRDLALKKEIANHLFDILIQLDMENEIENLCDENLNNHWLQLTRIDYLIKIGGYDRANTMIKRLELEKHFRIELQDCVDTLYKESGNKEYYVQYYKDNLYVVNSINFDALEKLKRVLNEDEWITIRTEVLLNTKGKTQRCKLYHIEKMYDVLIEELADCELEEIQKYEEGLIEYNPDWILERYKMHLEQVSVRPKSREHYKNWVNLLLRMLQIPGGNQPVQKIVSEWQIIYGNRPALMDELRVVMPFIKKEETKQVKLFDLIEALEFLNDETYYVYHIPSQRILLVSNFVIEGEVSEEEIEENWDDYISLPNKYDVNEYEMMEGFVYSMDEESFFQELCNSIHGKGAFRRFKNTIHRLKIEQKWYKFRDDAYKQIAINWCMEYDITPI